MRQPKRSTVEPAVCSRCKGSLKPAGGARAAYDGMIARFRVLGYPQCPDCRDYVLTLGGHACAAVAARRDFPMAA